MPCSPAPPPPHNSSGGALLSALILFAITALSSSLKYPQQHQLINKPVNKSVPKQKRYQKLQLGFLFPSKNFEWSAALNRSTGIASSIETSTISPSPSSSPPKEKLQDTATKLFEPYVQFLSKRSLTFGLFKSAQIFDESKKMIGTSLQDVLFGIDFLIFGLPRSSSVKSGNKEEKCATVDIPIIGGLLAIIPSQKKATHINTKEKNEEGGCLRFTLIQQPSSSSIQMQTEIADGYHPKLAGSSLPIPLIRKVLYRSTQSVVHAYVMWRYHGHCAVEYANMCCSNDNADEGGSE